MQKKPLIHSHPADPKIPSPEVADAEQELTQPEAAPSQLGERPLEVELPAEEVSETHCGSFDLGVLAGSSDTPKERKRSA